jgi:hypothetical protein
MKSFDVFDKGIKGLMRILKTEGDYKRAVPEAEAQHGPGSILTGDALVDDLEYSIPIKINCA